MISSLSIQQRGRKRCASELEPSASYILPSADTKRSRSTGAYDPNFRQRMINDRIYHFGYKYPDSRVPPKPQNWNEIQQILAVRRQSVSSSTYAEELYDKFAQTDAEVTSEDDVMGKVIPMIQSTDTNFTGNVPFNNLADMMRGKGHKAKPDRFYGARPEQLHLDVRDKLQALVIPALQSRPIAPNFFVEVKSYDGSDTVLLNQACFAGAVGARGIHSLQTYGEQTPKYDNNAYTLSATYRSGQLKIYSHHVSQPNGPGTQPEYYMHQLYAWALTASKETLIQGITAFRPCKRRCKWLSCRRYRNSRSNRQFPYVSEPDSSEIDEVVD